MRKAAASAVEAPWAQIVELACVLKVHQNSFFARIVSNLSASAPVSAELLQDWWLRM